MGKKMYISLMTFFVLAVFFFLGIIGLLVYPYKVLSFNYDKAEVITPIVKAGDEVRFKVDYVKYGNLYGTVARQLVNEYVYYYSPVITSTPPGHIVRTMAVTIPSNAEPGIYFIRSTYVYRVNFLREITYVKETENFEVIDNE
jgi:hypothetical protein